MMIGKTRILDVLDHASKWNNASNHGQHLFAFSLSGQHDLVMIELLAH